MAVDWATVNVKGAHVYDFTGDRWGQIWPATTDYFWYSPIDGQRVILYFNPLYDNYPEGYDCSVKVLNIKEILTKPIEELTAENVSPSVMFITSVPIELRIRIVLSPE